MGYRRKTMRSEQVNLELGYIPGEIVEEILLNLPVKSLLRFRCVAKSWNTSISSKKFVKTHLKRSAMNTTIANPIYLEVPGRKFNTSVYCTLNLYSPHSLFYDTREPDSVEHQLDYTFCRPLTCIVGYSNGLCCIRAPKFVLWNPSTRMFRELPPIYDQKFIYVHNCGGFGFDESSDDYKILAVVIRSHEHIIRLYSLRTNSWNTIENFLPKNLNFIHDHTGVLVNGKLHWYNMRSCIGLKIISFDLGSHAAGSVKVPSFVEKKTSFVQGSRRIPTLTLLDGSLCIRCDNQNDELEIWIMKEYGVKESWCKLITILTDVARIIPLCLSREGEILLLEESSLIIYNPKENSIRHPKMKYTAFQPIHLSKVRYIGFYHESLVSPFPPGDDGDFEG